MGTGEGIAWCIGFAAGLVGLILSLGFHDHPPFFGIGTVVLLGVASLCRRVLRIRWNESDE